MGKLEERRKPGGRKIGRARGKERKDMMRYRELKRRKRQLRNRIK